MLFEICLPWGSSKSVHCASLLVGFYCPGCRSGRSRCVPRPLVEEATHSADVCSNDGVTFFVSRFVSWPSRRRRARSFWGWAASTCETSQRDRGTPDTVLSSERAQNHGRRGARQSVTCCSGLAKSRRQVPRGAAGLFRDRPAASHVRPFARQTGPGPAPERKRHTASRMKLTAVLRAASRPQLRAGTDRRPANGRQPRWAMAQQAAAAAPLAAPQGRGDVPTWHLDEPLLPLLSTLPDDASMLPVLASLPSATIDPTFDDLLLVDADDFSARWLRRETTAAEAPASTSSGAPGAPLRVRSSSGHAARSRSPQMPTFFTGPLFFSARPENFLGEPCSYGEAMRDLLVGSARRHGLALWTLPGEMTYAAVELACRRRCLSEIRRDVIFYFGITENPRRRWAEHTEECSLWQEMIILVQADSSRCTGGLERIFIADFGTRLKCLNVGQGGERCSAGSPHFFYMLVGHNGLIRSRRRVHG